MIDINGDGSLQCRRLLDPSRGVASVTYQGPEGLSSSLLRWIEPEGTRGSIKKRVLGDGKCGGGTAAHRGTGAMSDFIGTSGNDTLTGGSGDDFVSGQDGDDSLLAATARTRRWR